jgi:competence protein ComEC
MKKSWHYGIVLIILVMATIFVGALSIPDDNLHLIACDVGQGDAILFTKGNIQILTDGGANNEVLNCLSKYLPFWDRRIELVVLTHPQQDHYQGLIEVFKRYQVTTFLTNDLDSSNQSYQVLKNVVGGQEVETINPEEGMSLRVGMIYLDILHTATSFSFKDVNDASIVTVVRFADFEAILTGDIGPSGIEDMLEKNLVGPVDYIKVPHHGSKNGLTKELLDAAKPRVAVISAGKNNRYGHPHQEILKLLDDFGIKTLRTDEAGDVEVSTDGERIWFGI